MIKDKYPSIWALGGNIRGNDQYRKLYPITQRGGTANSDMEINALELREAWVARHYEDFRIAGVIAQIKWLAVGSRGEQYMKNLVRERIDNMKHSEMLLTDIEPMQLDDVLAHFGVKGMRWGVRRASGASSTLSTLSGHSVSRKDEHFIAKTFVTASKKKVIQDTRDRAKSRADQINNDPKYKDSWKKPNSPAHRAYLNAHAKNLETSMNDAVKANWKNYNDGITPSGKLKASIAIHPQTLEPHIKLEVIPN